MKNVGIVLASIAGTLAVLGAGYFYYKKQLANKSDLLHSTSPDKPVTVLEPVKSVK